MTFDVGKGKKYIPKRGIFRVEKDIKRKFIENKEDIVKGFKVISGFAYSGKLKMRQVEKQMLNITLITIINMF